MVSRRDFLAVAATSGGLGRHRVYEFHGAPYDVGLQHGTALRAEIIAEAGPALMRLSGGTQRIVNRYDVVFPGLWEKGRRRFSGRVDHRWTG